VPRRRDIAGQQERLSAAVWSVLAEAGPTGLTVRAVAQRAGSTTGLLMHAFPDKRALLRHAREVLHRRTGERADRAERQAATPAAALQAVLEQALALDDAGREHARVWLAYGAAALADPQLAALHRQHNRAFLSRIERLLEAALPDLPARERSEHAVALVGLVEGLATLAALDPDSYRPATQRAAVHHLASTLETIS
jgi:AcrR family transcriptional regulator